MPLTELSLDGSTLRVILEALLRLPNDVQAAVSVPVMSLQRFDFTLLAHGECREFGQRWFGFCFVMVCPIRVGDAMELQTANCFDLKVGAYASVDRSDLQILLLGLENELVGCLLVGGGGHSDLVIKLIINFAPAPGHSFQLPPTQALIFCTFNFSIFSSQGKSKMGDAHIMI